MHLWFILGTAAELIKVYPLLRVCIKRKLQWTAVSSGQSGNNFWNQWEEFALPRENSLSLVATDTDLKHSIQAGRWLVKALCARLAPMRELAGPGKNIVVVHGDTLTTVMGSFWAWRLGWPVAHVEAGLRSRHWWQPFPEELNRRLVSRMVQLHFAPGAAAVGNLKKSGTKGRIVDTLANSLWDAVSEVDETPAGLNVKPLAIANLHRYENLNTPSRWRMLMESVIAAARTHHVIMVLHPQTRYKLEQDAQTHAALIKAGVELRPRMLFKGFITLLRQADFLITDGGSNQEECYYLGKPCLVLRDITERQEGLGSTTVLSHFNNQVVAEFLRDPARFKAPPPRLEQSPSTIMIDTLIQAAHGASS